MVEQFQLKKICSNNNKSCNNDGDCDSGKCNNQQPNKINIKYRYSAATKSCKPFWHINELNQFCGSTITCNNLDKDNCTNDINNLSCFWNESNLLCEDKVPTNKGICSYQSTTEEQIIQKEGINKDKKISEIQHQCTEDINCSSFASENELNTEESNKYICNKDIKRQEIYDPTFEMCVPIRVGEWVQMNSPPQDPKCTVDGFDGKEVVCKKSNVDDTEIL